MHDFLGTKEDLLKNLNIDEKIEIGRASCRERVLRLV